MRVAGDPDALHSLGAEALSRGDADAAIALLERAVDIAPEHGEAHGVLGLALQRARRSTEALAALRRAVYLRPDLAGAHNAIGTECLGRSHPREALAAFETALALRPRSAAIQLNVGLALQKLGRLTEARSAFERAIALRPDLADAHNALGTVLQQLGHSVDAAASYRHALSLNPDYAIAHGNLGRTLRELGRVEEALRSYDAALEISPDFADAHWNRSLIRLLTGDFAPGWEELEWRWRVASFPSARRNFAVPLWNGEPLGGAAILLHAEQGFGDTLQFLRYVPMVAERGGRVVLEVQPQLLPLVERLPGVDALVRPGDVLPRCDWHAPLLSLPRAFGTTRETIPASVPYLEAHAARIPEWRARFSVERRFKVGLVWAGRPTHVNDKNRSLAPQALMPLLGVPGVAFYSLQVGGTSSPPAGMVDLAPHLRDFGDTAAALSCLDLVITVDTSTAHLAGALGRPVWTLIPFAPDWRWLLGCEDSPWYPSMRLFRQRVARDWRDVVARVAAELARLTS